MRPVPKMCLADVLFGDIKHLPMRDEIPERFWRGNTPWNRIVARWFFTGIPNDTIFKPKASIDVAAAKLAIVVILRSFEPKHEHKEAAAAFLLSEWFEEIIVPGQDVVHAEEG